MKNLRCGGVTNKISLAAFLLSASPAAALTLSDSDIDAIGRTVYAESASQPIDGKVAVLDTILNRVSSGDFGSSVQSVIEQRNAFEPVTVAGGWRNLPPLTDVQRVEFVTILTLKASGHLGDLSVGALYFQNPETVKSRARRGSVRKELVGFNGMPVTVEIADHTFYSPSATGARKVSVTIPKAPEEPSQRETVFLQAPKLGETVFLP